jgi:hypothetical protein
LPDFNEMPKHMFFNYSSWKSASCPIVGTDRSDDPHLPTSGS